ncbi:hypothetical protein C3L33_11800, partial [Rhododendron williamsianum]
MCGIVLVDVYTLRSIFLNVNNCSGKDSSLRDDHSEPVAEICAQLTQEFFRDDMLRLLIICLPKLDSGARQDAAHVVKNLHGQRVNSRLIASDYMEENADLVDILELLTRHKSTVADFLLRNYQWFFRNTTQGCWNPLIISPEGMLSREGNKNSSDKILASAAAIRRDINRPSNSSVMVHYVSSLDNMRDSNKTIQLDAFQVFKLFIDNQNKPPEIISILVKNRSKLLQFFGDFELGKKDEAFEADKAQVVKDIALL